MARNRRHYLCLSPSQYLAVQRFASFIGLTMTAVLYQAAKPRLDEIEEAYGKADKLEAFRELQGKYVIDPSAQWFRRKPWEKRGAA